MARRSGYDDGMNCRSVKEGLWLYSVTSDRASLTIKTLIVNDKTSHTRESSASEARAALAFKKIRGI